MNQKNIFLNRLSDLQEKLGSSHIGSVLLVYSRDILYYTGTAQPGFLGVTPDDYILYVKSGKNFVLNDVFIDLSKIIEERKLANVYEQYFSKLENKKIGLELDILSAIDFMEYQRIFKGFEFINISSEILMQRSIKDPYEIEQIRKAGLANKQGYEAACTALRPGITELELSAAVEHAHRLAGHEGSFFSGCMIFS
ncbi:MAG: aminopeptidase P family N-terminal domain-containing protein [Desulfobacula sp.]|nr:aminopeptidase P family N-terminal domain-containing protein [Desulfobacula sp.]